MIFRASACVLVLSLAAFPSPARGGVAVADSEALLDGRPWQLGTLVPHGRLRCVELDVEGGLEHCVVAAPELGRTIKLARYIEGDGLRLSANTVTLRGGLDAGVGYDSNQLLENVEQGTRGGGVLRVLGHGAAALSGGPVGARVRLALGYRDHFGGEAPTGALGGLDVDSELLIRAVSGSLLRLDLRDTFTRSAAVPLTGARHRSALLENAASTRMRLLLGDLALYLEYQLARRIAEVRELAYQDRLVDGGAISLRWLAPLRVVEAISLNLRQQWVRRPDDAQESRPFRGTLGLLARTAWFYAALELGYGASFVAGGEDYDGVIASTEVGGVLWRRVHAWLGFHHDFDGDEQLDYLLEDVFFGGADFVVADGLLVVHQRLATRWRRPRGRRPLWLVDRDLDHFLTALGFGAQLRLSPWLSLGLDYDLQLRMAPFEGGAGSWSYVDHRVMVGFGVGS